MKLNDRQKLIIDYAKSHDSFQTKAVFDDVKKKFSVERLTVVRDLAYLVESDVLVTEGEGRTVKYQVSAFYLLTEKIAVDEYFATAFQKRKIKHIFNTEIFTLLDNHVLSGEEVERLDAINQKYATTQKVLQDESPAILRREWERLVIEFSWKSSQIEGNTYTLLETEALLNDAQFAQGKDKTEAQMIINHKSALDFTWENKEYFEVVEIEKIKKIHELLVTGLDIKFNYRQNPVGISGTLYRPLHNSEEIEDAMKKLVQVIRQIEDPFNKALIAVLMISYIQPFEDGNKRTARIVANAILHAHGKAMLSYRDVDTVEYKKAILLFYEQNNISAFKKIFIEQFEFSVENYFLK